MKKDESIRDTSITRNKSQINKKTKGNISRISGNPKKNNFRSHKKRSTFTHFQTSGLSTKDNTINQTMELNKSKKRKSVIKGNRRASVIGNTSNIFKDSKLIKSNINGILNEPDSEKPDVMGKFRQRYAKTMTNIDEVDIKENVTEFNPNKDDLQIIQDLQEFIEIFNGKIWLFSR
jgi:hypothetical protein